MTEKHPYMNKAGRCTHAGLIRGYGESKTVYGAEVTLWQESPGCAGYHVRAHEFDGRGRLFWEAFPTLTEARRYYDRAKKTIREMQAALREAEQARLLAIAVRREELFAEIRAENNS